jgi:hypothetical protein
MTKIPGTFVTYAAGFDKNVPKINSGFGFLVVRDQLVQETLQEQSLVLILLYGC